MKSRVETRYGSILMLPASLPGKLRKALLAMFSCPPTRRRWTLWRRLGYLAPGTRNTLVSSTLIIVVPFDDTLKIHSAADLASGEVQKIAISQPSSVPVGIYSKE